MTAHHPQRRRRSRPRVLQRAAQRAKRLDGRRSGGYSATNAQGLCSQHVHAQQPPRLRRTPSERLFFPLVADSTHVHPQQPVNASVFAACGCSLLIPLWFPQRNSKFLYSSHSGVTCPYPAGAEHRVFAPGRHGSQGPGLRVQKAPMITTPAITAATSAVTLVTLLKSKKPTPKTIPAAITPTIKLGTSLDVISSQPISSRVRPRG
jgi:hypothetical protein